MKKTVVAFDFGASSGRAIKGIYENKKLQLEEIHRFENTPIYHNGHMCHNLTMICKEIEKALEKAGEIHSLAFDTWGVDYVLIDDNSNICSPPIHYRDTRTAGMEKKVFEKISPYELYRSTGNQIMEINTLFQLMCETDLKNKHLLFMPDYFAYYLCKKQACEITISSTSQMLNPVDKSWSKDVLKAFNISPNLFPPLCDSATIIGEYNKIKVICVAGHDTQCAIAAMPCSQNSTPAFLSCGTWSLIGCETDSPILTEKSMHDQLSNEIGANGKNNYLKNISGLWLIQQARREFAKLGCSYSYNDMEMLARKTPAFLSFIDPDHPSLSSGNDIISKIKEYCKSTFQNIPESHGEIIRCIYESLAMKYAVALNQISDNTQKNFDVLHMLGGGTKDPFLCQITADSLGIPVIAGPCEATAIGNIMLQLIALGEINDISQGRKIIAENQPVTTYMPQKHNQWKKQYKNYCEIIKIKTEV